MGDIIRRKTTVKPQVAEPGVHVVRIRYTTWSIRSAPRYTLSMLLQHISTFALHVGL